MIYRTAHRATYRSLNNNLGSLSYRIAQLTNQIASERRINTPSDDPSGAAKVLGTRSTLSSIEQYKTNIAVSELWLSDSGNAIQSIKETLDEIYTKAEQGATDTNGKQLSIVAEEINLLFKSLIQYGDAKIGDSYIFGGQKVTTQPFGTQVEAQKVVAGCQNSTKWTGKVQNYGDPRFNNRPDLPIHSQNFLVEVVQPGGVDSRYYTKHVSLGTSRVSGTDANNNSYGLGFTATAAKYDNTEIKFVAGAENKTSLGDLASDAGLTFSGGVSPTNIVFAKGAAGATTTSWDAATNTLTVALETNSSGACVATANDVETAINAASPPGVTATAQNGGAGVVSTGKTSFNNGTTVKVDGNQIIVYLERDNDHNGQGAIKATAADVKAALDAHPAASAMITTTASGTGVVEPMAAFSKLSTSISYTLAHKTIDPKGTQNGLVWSVQNKPGFTDPLTGLGITGSEGNDFTIEYRVPENPFSSTASVEYDPLSNPPKRAIVVNVAVDADVYSRVFSQVYTDPNSGAFQDQEKANEMALREAITTTANDVVKMVNETPIDPLAPNGPKLGEMISVTLADGNSGEGKINKVPESKFMDGYEQETMFRVSQDGGKTWGPPMSFAASEYMTGDMFYNAYLGHASMTTNLRGSANDLVFTAKQMGTWGNDIRVEYKSPDPAGTNPQAPSITVGPNPWNICVTLGTDASGEVNTTANEIMDMINNHPEASQLVLADLANYHEGGGGIVRPMECAALSVGEPYQIDGKTVITALGHASTTVSFPYTAAAQSCPNIVFQAIEQGPDGNDIGVRYTTSADPTYYSSASVANGDYQDFTTVRYEKTADGKTVMVVHLATEALPSCPDEEDDPDASAKWKELYPVYSCTSARAVTATAGSVVQAIIDLNTQDPANAALWPSLERWPQGWDSTAKVGPTDGTVWLTGGNETDDASNHGVNLKFISDGSSLQVGDVFEVAVGWYRGDDKDININAGSNYQTTMNTTGNQLMGGNGDSDNILDTVQRLIWALEQGDTALVGKELPKIREAIEKVTTLETKIGTKQIRNEFVLQNLETSKLSAQNLLSQIEDADFAQLITDLKNAQTVYEACLGATGLTNRVSLLNYI